MLKPVLTLTLLCAPALAAADSPTRPATPPAPTTPTTTPATTTYVIELATKSARHSLLVADRSCAELQLKSPQRESFLRVCAHAADSGKHVRLDVERRTRESQDESRQTAVVVAQAGATYDLLDGKLSVKTR